MTIKDSALAGKTAFISGSGRNIGRAIAVQLAARGANLVINGVSNQMCHVFFHTSISTCSS